MKSTITLILLLAAFPKLDATDLVTYDPPEDIAATPEFELEVNGQKVFVYNTRAAAIAYFSFEGKADVKFKDISVEGEQFPCSQLLGFDETYRIKGIELENFIIHGVKVSSTYNGMITTKHADDIAFK
ncbi:MAG: hypothetical protein V2B15_16505 [Bacteroidota bacterium]